MCFWLKKKIIAIHFNKESHLSIGFSANTGIQLYLCIHSRILPCSLQRVHIARSYRTRLSSSAVFTSIRMWTINREKVSRNVSMAPVMENATKLCICVYHDNFQLMNNWVNRKKIISRTWILDGIFFYLYSYVQKCRRFFEKMM